MSAPDDEVSVEVDGVTVRKTVNDHQFETLAVVFDLRSAREEPVDVSVVEGVPDGVVEDDVGFHPEYGGEHWRAGGGTVTFSRTFEPDEQYTTVYGIRDFDGDRADLLAEPTVTVGDERAADDAEAAAAADGPAAEGEEPSSGVEDIDDLVSEDDSDPVREVIAGEGDSLPGMEAEEPAAEATSADEGAAAMEDDEGAAVPEEPAPGAAEPDDEAEEPAAAAVGEEGEEPEDGDQVTVPVTGGIARVLAKELRAGNVSYEDRELLRDELLPDEGSTDARIRTLQQQVADLTAYTGALEEFLDEEGGAEAILGELEDEIEGLDGDVEEVADGLAGVEDDVGSLEATVDGVEDDVAGLDADLESLSGDVDGVAGRVDDVERDVRDVESELDRLDAVERRLDGLEDDVADIHDELADLATFRDRLSSVFGPGGGGVGGEGAGGGDQSPGDDGGDADGGDGPAGGAGRYGD